MIEWDIEDFVGAAVTVSLPGLGERPGTVTAISKVVRPAWWRDNSITKVIEKSTFLVALRDDGTVIEIKGDRFTQFHAIQEMDDDDFRAVEPTGTVRGNRPSGRMALDQRPDAEVEIAEDVVGVPEKDLRLKVSRGENLRS